MGQVLKFGLMARNTKERGNTIRLTARANSGTRTAMFTKDSGKTIKQMDMAFTYM